MGIQAGWEGHYFEDFNIGDVYRCRLGRTITETVHRHQSSLSERSSLSYHRLIKSEWCPGEDLNLHLLA